MGTKHFQKVVIRIKLFLSLSSFTHYIVNIGVWKYVSTGLVIKMKIFHSWRTRVVLVSLLTLVSDLRCTRAHLCRSCLALVLWIRLDLKNKCVCFNDVIWLMKMKSKWNKYHLNRRRPRYGYKMCLSIFKLLYISQDICCTRFDIYHFALYLF